MEYGSREEAKTVMRSIVKNLDNEFVVRLPKRLLPQNKNSKISENLGREDNFREMLIKQNRLQAIHISI